MAQTINKAYSILSIIKRNFIYMDESSFIILYKSVADHIWNMQIPCGVLINKVTLRSLKKIQKRATKL